MRFIRLGAFLAWGAIASFAVAGFAAFNPATAPTTTSAPPAAVSQPAQVGPDAGSLAGRVAARTFGSSPTIAPARTATTIADVLSASSISTPQTTSTTQLPTSTSVGESTTTSAAPVTTVAQPTTTTTAAETTTTTSAPAEPYIPAGTEGWVSLVESFFAPDDVEQALLVMWCESRGDANATNSSSGAAGLYQHLPKYWEDRSADAGWAGADIYDPTANTAVAAWLVYSGGGWKHWNPSAYCWG